MAQAERDGYTGVRDERFLMFGGEDMTLTAKQQDIQRHCRNGLFDRTRTVDSQVSLANMDCFVGMIETGEATFDDFEAVGGVALAAAVAKTKQNMDDAMED